MGEEPVGDEDPDATSSKNLTLKNRTWAALAEHYPHALDDQERVRYAIHEVLENADENESE